MTAERDWSTTGKTSAMVSQLALPRRLLGRTAIQVSALGFGTAPLGDLYRQLDDGRAIAAVERALALGINLIDTSPLYGHGLSEHRCGTAIRRLPRDQVVLCTKVGRWMDPFHGRGDGRRLCGARPASQRGRGRRHRDRRERG